MTKGEQKQKLPKHLIELFVLVDTTVFSAIHLSLCLLHSFINA